MINPPRWLQDLERLLPIRSQAALSGNIRDSFLMPMASGSALVPLLRCLWEMLRKQGYQCALVYDPADGLRAYPNEAEFRERADRLFRLLGTLVVDAIEVSASASRTNPRVGGSIPPRATSGPYFLDSGY